jgi:hypothetical protein
MITATRIDVWSATIEDHPGGLKEKLEALAIAGADLEFLIARRLHEAPGKGIVFLTPLRNQREIQAAEKIGLKKNSHVYSVRVIGPDEPGIAYRVTVALADEAINVRGVSAGRVGREFVMFLAFDTENDADRAAARLNKAL